MKYLTSLPSLLHRISTPAGVSLPLKPPEEPCPSQDFLEHPLTWHANRAHETSTAFSAWSKRRSTFFTLDFTKAKRQSEMLGGEVAVVHFTFLESTAAYMMSIQPLNVA